MYALASAHFCASVMRRCCCHGTGWSWFCIVVVSRPAGMSCGGTFCACAAVARLHARRQMIEIMRIVDHSTFACRTLLPQRASGGRVGKLPLITRKRSNYSPNRGTVVHHCGPDKQWPHGFCAKFRGPHRCTGVAGFIARRGGCDWFQPAEEDERQERADDGDVSHNRHERRIRIHGLDIAIEHEKGSTSGDVTIPFAYGYIRAADGGRVDVMLGPHLKSEKVFVVDQEGVRPGAMIGFGSLAQARSHYLRPFQDGRGKHRLRAITEMTIPQFKEWLKGDTTKPAVRAA
jgi:Inorganic Pyrophosphatase